ncbi:methyl-accepting chemotaxis protein [Domibacillus sp. DTU_2020_1001157_1_SI_ALB_TIR_016]|uniref:methyl-accepting chemotaxis protein n=1 Tax=Domibacillus sp. DTU_2020_1001157_1_SI_ALB_TIR_016 TaxID=3077789 RepID=UPI0028EC9568|nr:methyl-accepting chemotaxis protein [Domibacillus sp. DTU_2020_1001157_1_SI_ALB_TIR_016]WNS77898.1 methyl-accepting chemotaxis protein [Domibacillus sp. DTU_2020_1001157_1_SI_ALB_TIR_016]
MRTKKTSRKELSQKGNRLFAGSLKNKLIISFTLILIIPSLIIGSLSYVKAKTSIQREITNSAETNVQLLSDVLDAAFKAKMEQTNFLAGQISKNLFKDPSYKTLHNQLAGFYNTTEGLLSVYVGTTDGTFVMEPALGSPEGYDPRERGWYKQAMEHQGEAIITSPYPDASTGKMVVTIASALKDGSGVVGFDLEINSLGEIVSQASIGQKGYPFIMDGDQKIVFHPTAKSGETLDSQISGPLFASNEGHFEYKFEDIAKDMVFLTNPTTGWKVAGTMEVSEFTDASESIWNSALLTLALSLIAGSLFVFFVLRSILRPISRLMTVTEKVSNGDLTERVDVKTKDEIGQLGTSFNQMIDSLRSVLTKINDSSQHLAASTQQLSAGSEYTAQTTKEVADAIQEVASGSESQMTSTEESAKATEEIARGIQYIAEGSNMVSESSVTASQNAQKGNEALEQVTAQMKLIAETVNGSVGTVKLLEEHSQEIGKITDVITQIADQTNLLALNAAIEAARAGEQGKGFAVVAEEVRKLAEESKKSANQISNLISTIQKDTAKAVTSMEKGKSEVESGYSVVITAGEAFEQIFGSVQKVTEQIQEVSATSQEISASAEEVTASVEEVSSIASETAASANQVAVSAEAQLHSIEEITKSIHELSKLATDLQETVNEFRM